MSDTIDILVPEFGHGLTEALVIEWLVAEGDRVERGDVVAVLETDKSSVDLLAEKPGTVAEIAGHYPGWTPNPASPLLATCQRVYQREFKEDSHVQVIHAGLECGIIAAKYPGMDIVSFGPTIRGAHAPGESVDIASVERAWHLLTAILADLTV